MISFFVECTPIAQPRQRHAVRNGHAINYLPKSHPIHIYKQMVQIHARMACPGIMEGPVGVNVMFLMPRPASRIWKRKAIDRAWHVAKPDQDNLVKGTFDAMNGIVWRDDSQVCRLMATKMYAAGDEKPGVMVQVYELAGVEGI